MTLSGSAAQCDSHGDEARNTTDSINTRLKNVPEHILFRSKHMFSRWIGASIGSRLRSILGQIVPDKVRLVQNAHEVLIFQLDTLSIRGSNGGARHQQGRNDHQDLQPGEKRPGTPGRSTRVREDRVQEIGFGSRKGTKKTLK